MGKYIIGCATLVSLILIAGIFPTVAVGFTAVAMAMVLIVFGKEV